MQQQVQQLQQALDKSNADKNAADAGKVQVDMKTLELKGQELQLENKKIEGELKLKAKELENELVIADMKASTDVHTNQEKNQVELIKNETSAQTAQLNASKEPESEPAPKAPDQIVNVEVKGSKVKKSVITPNENGSFDVVTEEAD